VNLQKWKTYKFKGQDEVVMVYNGTDFYLDDSRVWYQFSKLGSTDVWAEMLDSDLHLIEEVLK